jgi:hypothetical protein
MSTEQVLAHIALAQEELSRAIVAAGGGGPEPGTDPTSKVTKVNAGGHLQGALDKGGVIELEAGAVFEGHYIAKSNTTLRGVATLIGKSGAALTVPPGSKQVAIHDVTLATGAGVDAVLQVGMNDETQTTVADVPTNILLRDVIIPKHRGKRGLSLHATQVLLDRCEIEDCYDPGGQDSQAIYILNTPGDIAIVDSRLSAGSEVVLVGGDLPRIKSIVPENLLVERTEMYRPLSWQSDGVARKVKNIFELKSGLNVVVRHCKVHGCWAQGQQGEAFTLTPALGGPKANPILPSGVVGNVTIEDCDIWDVGGGVALLGAADKSWTAARTTGIIVRRNKFTISRAEFGGRGQLLTAGAGPGEVLFDSNLVTCDGTSSIYYYQGNVAKADGSTVLGGKMGSLTVTGNEIRGVGVYGFMMDGHANGRNWQLAVEQMVVTGNQFVGPSTMRSVFPENTYSSS